MDTSTIYSKRVIAFIDILGFKEHINRTLNNENYAKRLLNSLELIANIKTQNRKLKEAGIDKEITIFSDSVVISYPIILKGSVFYILMDLVHLQLEMPFRGILFRGGLVVGDVYHKDNIVFGPGMNQAYELESKHAKNPRIILAKKTIEEGFSHYAEQNTPEGELGYILDNVRKDSDGFYFIDYLKQWQELNSEDDYYRMINITRKMIQTELSNNTDNNSVIEKYSWLKDYYNLIVSDYDQDKFPAL